MKVETRLYVWIATIDDEGNIVRNAQDVSHVDVYTKEADWVVSTEVDMQLMTNPNDVSDKVLTNPFIDSELADVDYQIIRPTDERNFVDILKQFKWTYSKDKPVSFALHIESGSGKYGSDKYTISESVLDSLLQTFTGVSLSMSGNTVIIPNVTYPQDMESLIIEDAIVECSDMVASFNVFRMKNCILKRTGYDKPSYFNITSHTSFELTRVTLNAPVYFQVIAKNENFNAWKSLEGRAQFIKIDFNYEPRVKDTLFKFVNFNQVVIFDVYSAANNGKIVLFNFENCIDVRMNTIQRVCTKKREVADIALKSCAAFSLADSAFHTNLPNNASISDGKNILNAINMQNGILTLSAISIKNARLFVCTNSIIDKFIIDSVNTTEDKKMFVANLSTIKDLVFTNGMIKSFESFDGLNVNKIRLKDSSAYAKGNINLSKVINFKMENSTFVSTGEIKFELPNDGRVDIDNSVIKCDSIFISHPYTDDEVKEISIGDADSVYSKNKSTLSVSNLSTIEASLNTIGIGKVILNRCNLRAKSVYLGAIQSGESHFDIDSSYLTGSIGIGVDTLRNFNLTLIRSLKNARIQIGQTNGLMNFILRDPDLKTDKESQEIQFILDESKLRLILENGALASYASVKFYSKNSGGTSIEWSDENNSSETIAMNIDPMSFDFSLMRRRGSAGITSKHIVYG